MGYDGFLTRAEIKLYSLLFFFLRPDFDSELKAAEQCSACLCRNLCLIGLVSS